MKVSTILEKAAKRLEAEGWKQFAYGAYEQDAGSCCLVGCIRAAVIGQCGIAYYGSTSDDVNAEVYVSRLLEAGGQLPHVASWNDEPGRKPEEVIDLLIIAAEMAREEGL